MLKLGDDELFRVVRVDHDTAAPRPIQFANNVTRSRKGAQKQTAVHPEQLRAAVAAHRRLRDRAVRPRDADGAALTRQTDGLQDGLRLGHPPILYEDDLIRGYRFDVFDVDDGCGAR